MNSQKITSTIIAARTRFMLASGIRNPQAINRGLCAYFARFVCESHPALDAAVLTDKQMGSEFYSHTFLRIGDRYYDAECVYGEADWRELPCIASQCC